MASEIICSKKEFDTFNFPGSDIVWEIINNEPDNDDLVAAKKSWSKQNLDGTATALIHHAQKYDPALAGIQTAGDLSNKTKDVENACARSMDVLSPRTKKSQKRIRPMFNQHPFSRRPKRQPSRPLAKY